MFNDTITVFNRYSSRLGDTWYPTVVSGVNLLIDKAAIQAKLGPESSESAILNVHCQIEGNVARIGGKEYLPPKAWSEQLNADLANTITFNAGTDFFMLGEYDETPINDDDYADGFFNYMNSEKDYVFIVSSAALYRTIPHFEVMGK